MNKSNLLTCGLHRQLRCGLAGILMLFTGLTQAQHEHHEHAGHGHEGHEMLFDSTGMVMNTNTHNLPQDCAEISADVEFTVYAGTEYALTTAGRVFGYDQHEFRVPPCSRVTVHFVNEDQVRHQWMLHGLPRYLYPQGMFHLEASGGETVSGAFIVPSDNVTYLIHCDITQHMEKGMKAQLIVGAGSGDLWSIPGLSADFNADQRVPRGALILISLSGIIGGIAFGIYAARR